MAAFAVGRALPVMRRMPSAFIREPDPVADGVHARIRRVAAIHVQRDAWRTARQQRMPLNWPSTYPVNSIAAARA